MEQLSGLDSAFVYMENPSLPMHIGSLAIYDQSTAPGGAVGFKDILSYFEQRLHKARCFRQRLAKVPLGLDHPYWIEDPDFDLEYHVRHIALPHPGDWRQLCIQAARLHARPLDMNKPLWEFTVIEGLDNIPGIPKGSFALVTKVHHAAIDGVSGVEMAAAVHDLTPEGHVTPPTQLWQPDRLPTGVEMLGRSALNTLKTPLRLARLARSSAPSLMRLANQIISRELSVTTSVPRTRFNRNVSPHRVFDGRSFDLAQFKAIKNAVPGAKLNDAVVAVIAGAMREYLLSKDELPKHTMVAMAPISVRAKDQRGEAGNMVSAMSLPICSHIADPIERLQAVVVQSTNAKAVAGAVGLELSNELAHFLPSTIAGLTVRAYGRLEMAERLPPIFNTVITNVPGPGFPLYSMGSRLVANYGLGPIAHGVGLFQPVLSYNNTVTISAISCRQIMPDPAFYCDCLQRSFDQMLAAATAVSTSAANADATDGAGDAPKRKTRKRKARPGKTKAPANGAAADSSTNDAKKGTANSHGETPAAARKLAKKKRRKTSRKKAAKKLD